MSQLSYLEKLLDGVEVEWKQLGEVAEIKRGTSITKRNVIDGDVPVIAGGRSPAYYHNVSNRDGQTIVIAGSGAYAGFVSWWEQPIFVSDAFTVKPSKVLLARYCYHFLLNMQQQLHEFKSGGGIPHVYPRDVAPILIPIPCPDNPEKSLAIQSEIVQILDKFTALTAELTAELNMRKKQYNYYRDKLLSFEEGEVEWKTLGEMAEYSKARICYTELDDSNYVGVESLLQNRAGRIDSTRTPDSGNLTQYNPDDILIGNIRPYLKKIWHADRVGGTNGDVLVIHPTDTAINPRYLYQVLADDKFFEYNMQHAKGAKMPRGNKSKIMEYLVPIPFASNREKSLAEQERIVTILDKFDALTNSITEGLPREIDLRQKQYEYYRDLLLSFPKSDEAA